MQALKIQSNSRCHRRGSAMVLVIVVTVMLAAIGAMFILTARVDQMTSAVIVDNRNLTAGVNTVVNKIQNVLTEDLLGTGDTETQRLLAQSTPQGQRPDYANTNIVNEPWDSPDNDDWLSSLEPEFVDVAGTPNDYSDDLLRWIDVTDLWGMPSGWWYDPDDRTDDTQWDGTTPWFGSTWFFAVGGPVYAKIIDDQSPMGIIAQEGTWDDPFAVLDYGARADADGDGVADSRWVRIPGQQTADGRQMYAAVRIIDNNAMLNLNTAYHTISETSNGKYLSSYDYTKFLRGDDLNNTYRIRNAKYNLPAAEDEQKWHDNVVMNIENPGISYSLFDIGDELEIRNRYMLTSLAEARFEALDLAYHTFDYGRGYFVGGGYNVRRIPYNTTDFDQWKDKINPVYFDDIPFDFSGEYDRRHVCTFYSFDRNIRRRDYPFVDGGAEVTDPNRIDAILAAAPGVFIPLRGSVSVRDITSNTIKSRRNILHLLYAFRAYFIAEHGDDYKQAARRSAQVVANMIDYLDYEDPAGSEGPFFDVDYGSQTNDDPTFIDKLIVEELISELSGVDIDFTNDTAYWPDPADDTLPVMKQFDFGLGVDDPAEVVFGFERQPFISELYAVSDGANITQFAVELVNPYTNPNGILDISGWRIKIGNTVYPKFADNTEIAAAVGGTMGILVAQSASFLAAGITTVDVTGMGLTMSLDDVLELQRPVPDPADPANSVIYITVDQTDPIQINDILTAPAGTLSSKRDDTEWGFTNNKAFAALDNSPNLGLDNNVTLTDPAPVGFQMPVANNNDDVDAPWGTLGDLERVLFIGNDYSTDPNAVVETVTEKVAAALNESDVRYDIEANPELLEYISLINRDNGRIPGRINVNTATMEVLRAAIPPSKDGLWDPNDIAEQIADNSNRPYKKIGDLLNLQAFRQFETDPNDIGDASIAGDIEDRDWLLSLVANKFTVRSDVFTAYILVRIGTDGPQRRMIAILDRSEVYLPGDKPRVIAIHPVPDPR